MTAEDEQPRYNPDHDPIAEALRGVTFILLYLGILLTAALVLTAVQPGGPF